MKVIFTFLVIFCSAISVWAQPCPPCPDHIFVRDSLNCQHAELQSAAPDLSFSNSPATAMKACQYSTMTYNLLAQSFTSQGNCSYPGFQIDTVIVSGGTLLSFTNTSYSIQWGGSSTGILQILFSVPGGGSAGQLPCTDTFTITLFFNLIPNPVAAFTIAPNPACFNNPTVVNFNSSASVGAVSYFWNFGDGFTSTQANPSHSYTSPGIYTVCLLVTNNSGGNSGTQPISGNCLTCVDSVCHTLVIDSLPGPDISCIATVCAGESGTYCTSAACATYNWVVTGGVITSPNPSTSSCITVQWGSGNPQGTISLSVPGCPGFCSNATQVNIPIIPSSTTISGPAVVCLGATSAYSLPAWPGTTYNWSISGGQMINGNNTNTAQISTTWNTPGTYTITVTYFDTALNCGGSALQVVQVLPELKISGPLKRCAGQSSSLQSFFTPPTTPVSSNWTISPAVGASITGGNGTPTVSINWANPGTYVVTATPVSAGVVCGPASFTVVVYAAPIISAIVGADSICPGGINGYSALSNMSGAFTWNVTGGTFVPLGANNDSIQVSWNNSGPYSIQVTQTSYANNCPSLPFTKTVYPYPTPNLTGSTIVCTDDTVSYTITNIGAGNFSWSVNPVQFGSVISQSGNTVQIKWHGNNNPGGSHTAWLHYGICGQDSVLITINEPVSPVITASGSLCVGAGITLTSSGTGIFSWMHVEAPPYSSGTNTLSGINHPGHYQVSIQNYNGTGCNVSATYHIPAVGLPNALITANGPVSYCMPNLPSMTLSALTGIGYSYQWYLGATPLGTGSTQTVNSTLVPGAGTYVFTYVVTLGGCTVTSPPFIVVVHDSCPVPPGCSAGIAITSITGCNPFNLGISVTNGVYIIPGTQTVFHYEDGLVLSGSSTRTYNTLGYKQVKVCASVKMADSSVCIACRDTFMTVDLAANFITNINCGNITITNLSNVFAPNTIVAYNWAISPSGTFNNNTLATPTLSVGSSGTYTLTLTITGSNGCITSYQDTMVVTIPDADFTVSNSCVGTLVNFNNLVPAPINFWNFGDSSSSNSSPTAHAYASSGTYFVTHIVTDIFGCKDTVTKPINIIPAPICNISYTGPTTFCLGNNILLNACGGYTNYQWLNNGVPISGATNTTYSATQTGNYSFTAINGLGCSVNADTVSVTVLQSPSTVFTTTGKACFGDNYSVSVPSCTGCNYLWEVNNVFQQAGAQNSFSGFVGSAPFVLGTHWIKVTVFGSNGCTSVDSIQVTFNPQPTLSINVAGNPPQLCSNNIYTLTAVSSAASPAWAWTYNNLNPVLSTTPTLLASAAGIYQVMVTDGITSCTNTASQIIDPSPDLSLFPIGCDTLCQNTSIFVPLPSLNGNTSGYTITWYDNAPPYTNIVGTGISLNLSSLSLGLHNLSVIVVGPNGCVDTSNVYTIFVVPSTSSSITINTCGSYTWAVNGVTYTQSGLYTYSSINAQGCPHYDTLHLTLSQGGGTYQNKTVCDSFTWVVNGVTYTQSGVYVHTVLLTSGCIQSDTLNLVLLSSSTTNYSITQCDPYTWPVNGVTYTVSGTYTFTNLNTEGCLHTHILNLNLGTGTTQVTIDTGCISYTWSVNGNSYTQSGVYTHTIQSSNGCINTFILQLTIIPITGTSTTVTICANQYTWMVNGVTYTTSGTYYHMSLSTQNCEQIDTLVLNLLENTQTVNQQTACGSYTWPVNGVTYTASGTYTHTITLANGCIHTEILYLNITLQGGTTTVTASACGSYTWPVNGVTYTASGTYTHTQINADGCISTVVLQLSILPNSQSSTQITICDMYTWPVNGVTYTASGTYTHTTLNANGCVHTHTLILTILPTTIVTSYVIACGSYTWPVTGQTFTANCVYTHVVYTGEDCPHIYVLCLTILPNTSAVSTQTACGSYTWPVNGITYSASGVYTHTSLNAQGCLHTDSLVLTILPVTISTSSQTACGSYTWPVNGVTYTASGTYTHTIQITGGCPEIHILNLTINGASITTQQVIACDAYTWPVNGVTYTASGNYSHTVMSSTGCIQTTLLQLTINTSSVVTTFITACGSYTWPVNGVTYTASGNYMIMTIGPNGCPRLLVLCLIIHQNTSSVSTQTACGSYTWPVNGVTYTASGVYTHTAINAFGCVHTSILNLTINQGSSSQTSITACNSYTWPANGVTYTASGVYTFSSLNSQGCPHVSTLTLTILLGVQNQQSITACNSYTWPVNGLTYTASGTYTHTLLGSNGCVNSFVLNLTIHYGSTSTQQMVACNSYTWPVNGVTYTTSGTYTHTTLNSNGCLLTQILYLTILPGNQTTVNVFACDMYIWPVNGITYTASGTYTHTSLNANGCVNTQTLVLTLGTSQTVHIFDTACCSYTWALNGVTYTQSGIYSYFTTGPDGCPRFYILCVTIHPCEPVVSQVVACNSYTWPLNGITYTQSGTYTTTMNNMYGCPVNATLNLTVDTGGVTISAQCDSVCDQYTWPVNGVTYTVSGVYTYVTTGPNGCPHTYVLCLVVLHHTDSFMVVTATGSYTWPVNGVTYTTSGVYVHTLTNVWGCDSFVSLNLTIVIPPGIPGLQARAFLSGPFVSAQGMMHDSLRTQNLIPLNEPYSAAPYNKQQLLGGGGEMMNASVLNITGPDAIVDWVHLEIRNVMNPNLLVATRNALLQRDGDIVATDGVSPVWLNGLTPGMYFVSIKHRNHLGLMTAAPVNLQAGLNAVDFTLTPLYLKPGITQNSPANFNGTYQLLWSGDPNTNKNVKYNGVFNDKDPILQSVGLATPNNTVFGYRREDLNMDGRVRYNNTDNDRVIILNNVGISTPNRVLFQHTPN